MTARVRIGQFAGAHGVRGLVRVVSHCAPPENVARYGPVEDETGQRRFTLTIVGRSRGTLIARVDGVGDRDHAEALRDQALYVARDRLGASDDEEFLHADLIGLVAVDPGGAPLGQIVAVHDFGAGDVLEIARPGKPSVMAPFTRMAVPVVDLSGGRLTVDLPADWFAGGAQDHGRAA